MSRMLYKAPGPHLLHGYKQGLNHVVVEDDQVDDALAAGWFMTTTEAVNAYAEKLVADAKAQAVEAEKKTEDERGTLIDKAKALGIEVDGRWGNARIKQAIADAPAKA